VKDALAAYHAAHVPDTRPKSPERMESHREQLEAILRGAQAERLTYDALLRYRQERREDYKSRTKRRLHDIRHAVATELDEFGDRTAMKAALGRSDATVARCAEHRRFDRAAALFANAEIRHKHVTTPAQETADER
jgi:tRNA/tmRNA/rRNA uracil-C5-methylase (TrmA/RlmC/RlmD family)